MNNIIKLNQVDLLKKAIQILLPISLFSFLFSQPYMLDELQHLFHSYGSTLSAKFYGYNAKRNYAFLLFNGLLALIIKNSGLIRDSQSNSSSVSSLKMAKAARRSADGGGDSSQERTEAVIRKDGEEIGVVSVVVVDGVEDDKCDQIPITDEEDEDIYQIPAAEDEVEQQSVEELNRKCDDFIKKMRERIKMDSHVTL